MRPDNAQATEAIAECIGGRGIGEAESNIELRTSAGFDRDEP